jgi:TM2 domain-containing membrane protein YozV
MRFGSYRVFTFQLGSNNPTHIGRLTAAGGGVSQIPGQFESSNQTIRPLKTPNKFAGVVVLDFAVDLRGAIMMRDPFTAGLLSFIVPGVGQFYNGRILAGILWLIITPGFWIGSGGTLGWICHVIAAYTAYSYAKDHPVRRLAY